MPEGIEIEYYREAAEAALQRRLGAVRIEPAAFARGDAEAIVSALEGASFVSARRRGKLLLLDAAAVTIGLRFGMTGRLIVDGGGPIDRLEYSSGRDDPAWDRLVIEFADGGSLRVRDQRRLGSVELEPDEDALGPDVFALTGRQLTTALSGSSRPLKSRLMDQAVVAGLGNLLTDEILWRAGIHPERPADSIDADERRALLRTMRRVLAQLSERGGSHMGDLQEHRRPGGVCPRDGVGLERHTIGGRTTYACPRHQRATG